MATDTPEDWPDVEGALRTYLRNDADFVATFGSRAFFGVPRRIDEEDSFPMVVITRVGGGDDGSEVPMDRPMIQLDVYGRKSDVTGGGRLACTDAMNVLRKTLAKIKNKTQLSGNVYAWDPRVATLVFSPLPGDDRPRYIMMIIMPTMYVTGVPAASPDYYGGGYS